MLFQGMTATMYPPFLTIPTQFYYRMWQVENVFEGVTIKNLKNTVA